MQTDRWQRIEQLYHAALEHPASQRGAFLERACGEDQALRSDVERLIAGHERAGSFLDSPAWDMTSDTPTTEAGDSLLGQRIGRYQILSMLGSGGMGEVYLAEDDQLGRKVALKLLPARFSTEAERLRRFEQEMRAVSALNHPNIVAVYDTGDSAAGRFIVMELVTGRTLRGLAREPFSPESLVLIGRQVATALTIAHAANIIHRDIKPENIMVREDGCVKVLDFGLARLGTASGTRAPGEVWSTHTTPGMLLGTTQYMSPEQARGEMAGSASDIFSLGLVLYELGTGQHPFRADSHIGVLHNILSDTPVPPTRLNPGISRSLETLILGMLEKDPAHRPSAGEVVAHLTEGSGAWAGRKSGAVTAVDPSAASHREQSRRAQGGSEVAARWLRRKAWWLAATGLVTAATLALVFNPIDVRRIGQAPENHPRIESVAVLPLQNLSGDPDQEYFSDGMTEALIADLARMSGLRVISRTSVMTYKGARKPLPQIARELGVDAVIEGSVAQSGGRVRITAQLIDGKTDRHLWVQSYERDVRDVLSLQGDVARAIAQEIQITLTPTEQSRLATARPVNRDAHEAYLRGRYHVARGTDESVKQAIADFEQASRADPEYAPPYAGLSDAYSMLRYSSHLAPRTVMPQAKAAAARAVQLDPTLAEGHLSMAFALMSYEFDWPGAERELRQAIELSPNLAEAHHVSAMFLGGLGRHDEARAAIERARQLDPLSLMILVDAGWIAYLARDYNRTIDFNRRAIELEPNFWMAHRDLGLGYEKVGRYAEAVASLQKARQLDTNSSILEMLGGAYAAWGKPEEARRVLAELDEQAGRHYVCPYEIATVYAGLGDKESTLRLLEKGYQERADCMAWTGSDPKLDGLRGDPRFQDLVRRMGIQR
jgi:serine/threonine-protein kinase